MRVDYLQGFSWPDCVGGAEMASIFGWPPRIAVASRPSQSQLDEVCLHRILRGVLDSARSRFRLKLPPRLVWKEKIFFNELDVCVINHLDSTFKILPTLFLVPSTEYLAFYDP